MGGFGGPHKQDLMHRRHHGKELTCELINWILDYNMDDSATPVSDYLLKVDSSSHQK